VALTDLLSDPADNLAAIAAYLDGLDGPARWAQLSGLDRAQQRTLYRKAAGGRVDLDHFVAGAAPMTGVVHDGRNTLGLPSRLRMFQKHFTRPEAGAATLAGFNDGPTRRLIGPGYFVARAAAAGEECGVVFDYGRVPGAAPEGWPRIVPNTKGLQRFVFNGTRDDVRGVSAHACVGAAVRGDRPLDHYFVLCRRV
jgi:hypothetical protein